MNVIIPIGYEYLYLGTTPTGEDCAQVGSKNYYPRALEECHRFINQLHSQFSTDKVEFQVISCPHDFGTYLDIIVIYDENDEESMNQALDIENNLPEYWED